MWPMWAKVALLTGLIVGGLLAVPPNWFQPYSDGGNGGSVVTAVFNATASDGYLRKDGLDGDYSGAWSASSADYVYDTGSEEYYVGQRYIPALNRYMIYRAALYFNTSSIPDNVVVVNWTVSLYITYDGSSQDFELRFQNGMPTYPHDPLEAGDYYRGHYSSQVSQGRLDTSSITVNAYNNFTWDDARTSWINKTGFTKLFMRSKRDFQGVTPSTSEYIRFHNATYHPAKLYVKYKEVPQPSNVGYEGGCLGKNVTFHVFWNGSGLSGFVFGWDASGQWQNDSWTDPWTGTPDTGWSNVTKTVPMEPATIHWRIWCNDTNGWGDTGEQTFNSSKIEYAETITLQVNGLKLNNNGWYTVGSSPYLTSADYPANYVWTNQSDARIGNWTFQDINWATVLEVRLIVNYSSYAEVKVGFYNASEKVDSQWQNATETLPSTNGEWAVNNVTLDRDIWGEYYLDQLEVEFISTTASQTQPVKIDNAYLWVKGYRNQTRMLQWLFDRLVDRMVNDTFPYTKVYNEYGNSFDYVVAGQHYSGYATPELLSGVLLYSLTGNTTYLQYAEKVANWLNESSHPVCRLFQIWNTSSNTWEEKTPAPSSAQNLMLLAALTARNSSYTSLLKQAAENYSDIFVQKPEYRVAQECYINGSVATNYLNPGQQGYAIAALSYAGYVLDNNTLKDIAIRMCQNYTLSDLDIPYGEIYINGTCKQVWCKEDQHFGIFLLGVETCYYFTENETVKDLIKTLAEAGAQHFYYSSSNESCFIYKVNADTGVQDTATVHGFGYIDEALIHAYLIWNNETWIERVIDDFESNVILQRILTHDLIVHVRQAGQEQGETEIEDVNDLWNAAGKRVALILYNLNYSLTYHNATYLKWYNKLYEATSHAHYRKGEWGWVQVIYCQPPYNPYALNIMDVSLSTIFRNFVNITDKIINTFEQAFAVFGNPFTGEIGLSNPMVLAHGVNDTTPLAGETVKFYAKWRDRDGLSTAQFYWNASGSMQQNGSLSLSGTEAWSNFTRTLPSGVQVLAWYIVANDTAGNWGNTTTQYISLIYSELVVGWNIMNETDVDGVDVGHTLLEIYWSLCNDSITVTTISKYNGTFYTFKPGYHVNENVKILAESDQIYLYVTVAGTWYHEYP